MKIQQDLKYYYSYYQSDQWRCYKENMYSIFQGRKNLGTSWKSSPSGSVSQGCFQRHPNRQDSLSKRSLFSRRNALVFHPINETVVTFNQLISKIFLRKHDRLHGKCQICWQCVLQYCRCRPSLRLWDCVFKRYFHPNFGKLSISNK